MKVVGTEPALADLDDISRYLRDLNPAAADRIVDRIAKRAKDLIPFPLSCPEGRVPGTRELVVTRTDYILAYRVVADQIEILAVVHSARDWPKHFRQSP